MSLADAGRLFDEKLRGGSGVGSIARHAMLSVGMEKHSMSLASTVRLSVEGLFGGRELWSFARHAMFGDGSKQKHSMSDLDDN